MPSGCQVLREPRSVRSPSCSHPRVPPGRPRKFRGTRTAFFGRIFQEADSTTVPGTGRSRRQVRGIRRGLSQTFPASTGRPEPDQREGPGRARPRPPVRVVDRGTRHPPKTALENTKDRCARICVNREIVQVGRRTFISRPLGTSTSAPRRWFWCPFAFFVDDPGLMRSGAVRLATSPLRQRGSCDTSPIKLALLTNAPPADWDKLSVSGRTAR